MLLNSQTQANMYQRRSPPSSPDSVVLSAIPAIESGVDLGQKSLPISHRPRRQKKREASRIEILPWIVLFLALVVVGGTTWAIVFLQPRSEAAGVSNDHDTSLSWYTCPATDNQPDGADNFDPIRFQNHYLSAETHTQELDEFVANFRDEIYDDWSQTYTQMKSGMTAWKQRAIVPHVQAGDKIYESAIGLGLNAFMTLEIIQEEKGPIEVEVHGNEYLVKSTQRANEFLNRVLPSNVRKGNICVGDSTNISYVPSNAFDLVYTGYILPIGNPLHFDQPDEDPYGINHGRYNELCDGDSWRDATLREIAQRRQEDFYASWVGEMIRVAKPGKPILVEHVSQPKCNDRDDWGGVSKLWWFEAVERYNWPIDPNSVFMEDDHIYTFKRYHVFMRKQRSDNQSRLE